MWISSFPTAFIEEAVLSPMYGFGSSQIIAVWVYF
jgi:hypothetical protein